MKIKVQLTLIIIYISLILIFSGIYYKLNTDNDKYFNKKLTYLDCFYFSTTTMTNTGYGDILPTSDTTKLLISLQLILSVILVSFFVLKTAMDFKYKTEKYETKNKIELSPKSHKNKIKNILKHKNIDDLYKINKDII